MSVYLYTTFAAETGLAEGVNFAQGRISNVENSLIYKVGARKLTVPKMENRYVRFQIYK
jgi:hypothetical protein